MEGRENEMPKTLEAHDKLIRKIFEGSYQFESPDYQRPYAWTKGCLLQRWRKGVAICVDAGCKEKE